jgi:hypothetical protein
VNIAEVLYIHENRTMTPVKIILSREEGDERE